MYCLGSKEKTPDVPIPPGPQENSTVGPLARIHVLPGEVILEPGASRKFDIRGFDALGHILPPDPDWAKQLAWTAAGAKGQVSADGTFTVAADNVFLAGAVTAKLGELSAVGRVRVAPKLPIKETFDAMPPDNAPPGWIGVGGGKTKIEEKDGSRVLRKVASKEKPSPPFMRVRGYIAPPIAGGYTIETDILGTPRGERFRPDMGVINTRYFMMLMGTNELWVESWSVIPRVQKRIPFTWETNKWYRMKMRVDTSEKETKIRGKVWPRGEAEPKEWTVEVVDPFPNLEGSPGLYAYSSGTTPKSDGPEVFYDNLQVTRNE
jgi:hypothetical protein